jgi:hypothetical protein
MVMTRTTAATEGKQAAYIRTLTKSIVWESWYHVLDKDFQVKSCLRTDHTRMLRRDRNFVDEFMARETGTYIYLHSFEN